MTSRKMPANLSLKACIDWLLDQQSLATYKQHGNTSWSLPALVTIALLWAWGSENGLKKRFQVGIKILPKLFPKVQWGCTYQGFIKILKMWSPTLIPLLIKQLRQRMLQVAADYDKIAQWRVFAVDGTRIEVPRTNQNASTFADSNRRKTTRKPDKAPEAPQVWLTLMWHVGMGMMWSWKQGPGNSSERKHVLEMIDELPGGSLVVADAGFYGYDFWKSLLDAGHSFLIRVGGNVKLLKSLGYVRGGKGIVYVWPQKNRKRDDPPMVLRLLEFRDGRQSMWLVSNVLDQHQLCDSDALTIYRRRWGVELFFRGFKQTFGRSKLRSHSPENVQLELCWSLTGYWSMELLAIRELIAQGRSPSDLSVSEALHALRVAMSFSRHGFEFDLMGQLAAIRCDGYIRRGKCIRNWPRKRKRNQPKGPIITEATIAERKAAREIRTQTT